MSVSARLVVRGGGSWQIHSWTTLLVFPELWAVCGLSWVMVSLQRSWTGGFAGWAPFLDILKVPDRENGHPPRKAIVL